MSSCHLAVLLDAELFVYIPGFKKEPLLQYVDPSALTINYISFSSFGTNTARWFYDCGFDGFGLFLTHFGDKTAQSYLNFR